MVDASLAIVIAQISICVGAALGKGLFSGVGPEGVAALRTGIAALILVSLFRPWRSKLSRAQFGWLGMYGLALGGMNLLIYWAFERLPLGIAVAIEICGPIAVVVATSRTVKDVLWLTLAVLAILLLVPWPGATVKLDAVGIAFAGAAAMCWGLYIVIGKQASAVGGATAVAWGMTFACLLTLPAGMLAAGKDMLQPQTLAMGLLVALLSSALPCFLEMKALERLSSRVFSLVISATPAIAALAGFAVLGERLSMTQWVAIGLLIGASAGCTLASRPALEQPGYVHGA